MRPRRLLALAVVALPLVLAGCFDDGVHAVGTGKDQVAPGRYSTPGDAACYWARVRDLSGSFGAIVASNVGAGRQFVDVAPDDAGIETHGCGRWLPVPGATPSFNVAPSQAIPDGMARVGIDVMPGTWTTNGPPGGTCYWERLSGFSGELRELITNNIGGDPQTVTILPTDVGFVSQGCTGWSKVGA